MSADKPAAEAVEGPKKSKKKLIIMVVVGILVLGAAAHFTVLKPKAADASAKKPVPGKILSVPTQTLNLADGHLLQVGIGLQLTTTANISSITALYPKIDSLTLKELSPYTYKQLLGTADRNQAQRRLGKAISALLNPAAATTTTSKATAKVAKKAKASKKAKKAAAAKTKAAAAPPPQVLGTFFTTFLMQ